jgi:hypothetical protein
VLGARETPAPLVGLCGDDLLANRDPCHRRRSYSRTQAPEVATETLSLVESIARRHYFWAPISPNTQRAQLHQFGEGLLQTALIDDLLQSHHRLPERE